MPKVPTNEEFIAKCRKAHKNKYDYSKTIYTKAKAKVIVICPEHGEFEVTAFEHAKGKQCCPKCPKKKKMVIKTTEDFIKVAHKMHGNKYDYSKTHLINMHTPLRIICPEHGEFFQHPSTHLNGSGCRACGYKKMSNYFKKSQEQFIKECIKLHGNEYDYSKTKYIDDRTKVEIICHKQDKNGIEHGSFWQMPDNHLRGKGGLGQGCPKCWGEIRGLHFRLTQEEFIEKANKIHKGKYDYSKVKYTTGLEFVTIICPKHGDFQQKGHLHLSGHGCHKCSQEMVASKGAIYLGERLNELGLSVEKEKTFEWLRYKNLLKIDYYLTDYNVAIEYQGAQHFEPYRFKNKEESIKALELRKLRDKIKYEQCKEHNIPIEYILYNENVNKRLDEIIKKYNIVCKDVVNSNKT